MGWRYLGILSDFWREHPEEAEREFEYQTEQDKWYTVYECSKCGKLSLMGFINTEENWELPDLPGCEHWTGIDDPEEE